MSQVVHDHLDAGLQALKEDKLVKAEHEFTRAGDEVRLAETFVRQGRYDEATLLVEGKEDGRAKLMMALIARNLGDEDEYRRRLTEARNLGSHEADCLIHAGG